MNWDGSIFFNKVWWWDTMKYVSEQRNIFKLSLIITVINYILYYSDAFICSNLTSRTHDSPSWYDVLWIMHNAALRLASILNQDDYTRTRMILLKYTNFRWPLKYFFLIALLRQDILYVCTFPRSKSFCRLNKILAWVVFFIVYLEIHIQHWKTDVSIIHATFLSLVHP